MNLQLWHLKTASHPVKCFDVIMRSDKSIQLGEIVRPEIWRVQRKSITTSSANELNARKSSYFSTPNSMDPQLYFKCDDVLYVKCDDVLYSGHIWKYFTFSLHGDVYLVQTYKKSPENSYLAIPLLSLNRSAKLWFFSFSNAPVSLRGPLSPASTTKTTILFLARLTPVKISLQMQSGQEVVKRHLG